MWSGFCRSATSCGWRSTTPHPAASELRRIGRLARDCDRRDGYAFMPFRRPPRRAGSAKLGASAKLAIQRALTATTERGQRLITAPNLLLGVVGAEQGRVPRALRLAGIDIHDLRARI